MMRRATLLAVLGAVLATAPAHAGGYTVYACAAAGQQWDNRSWALTAPAAGVAADQGCAGGDANMGLNNGGGQTAPGGEAGLALPPPPGPPLPDFRLRKRIIFRNPTPGGTHRYYILSTLGGTVFEGAGDYADATRNALHAQGRWYGYPQDNADTGIVSVSRASFPALAAYRGDAR